jgi:hypothetical protein
MKMTRDPNARIKDLQDEVRTLQAEIEVIVKRAEAHAASLESRLKMVLLVMNGENRFRKLRRYDGNG